MKRIAISILLLCRVLPGAADSIVNSIQLRATPDTIRADGLSKTTIIAEARDRSGQLVADGTEIRFSTSLGNFDGDPSATALTAGGTARVALTSSTVIGVALVTATAGQASQQIQVTFGTQTIADRGPRYLSLAADWIAYSMDLRFIDAIGKVRARWRDIEIICDSMQVDVNQNILRAQNQIKVTNGQKTLEGSLLYFTLTDSRGILLGTQEGKSGKIFFIGEGLSIVESENQIVPEGAFNYIDTSSSAMIVRAKGLILYPNEKIQFRKSALYVNGGKVFSMPYHVVSLTGYGDDIENYVGYGTNGLTLDVPFYYSMTAGGTGAFRMRYQQRPGWLTMNSRQGWSLDLEQKYGYKSSGQGTINLSHIGASDYGVHWDHTALFNQDTRGYFYMDYLDRQNLYGMATLSRQMPRFTFNTNVMANKIFGDGMFPSISNLNWDTYLESTPKPLGKQLRWTLAGRTSYTTGSFGSDNLLKGVLWRLYAVPKMLDRDTSLSSSLSLGYTWGGRLASGNSILTTLSAMRRFSSDVNLMLSYDYTRQPSLYRVRGTQRLNTTLTAGDRTRWYAGIYSSYTLDAPLNTNTAYLSFRMGELWNIGIRGTQQKFGSFSYQDLELQLSRQIGRREALLRWSTSRHRIELELNAGTFGF